jgi:hypothetical protein
LTACNDGLDNDADGAIDYPADSGCFSSSDSNERGAAACDDGSDNDADGKVDYPADPGCTGVVDNSEFTDSPSCHPSYPTVCIPHAPPDLDCSEISHRNFAVRHDVADPDPHGFDGNKDGVGCQT